MLAGAHLHELPLRDAAQPEPARLLLALFARLGAQYCSQRVSLLPDRCAVHNQIGFSEMAEGGSGRRAPLVGARVLVCPHVCAVPLARGPRQPPGRARPPTAALIANSLHPPSRRLCTRFLSGSLSGFTSLVLIGRSIKFNLLVCCSHLSVLSSMILIYTTCSTVNTRTLQLCYLLYDWEYFR